MLRPTWLFRGQPPEAEAQAFQVPASQKCIFKSLLIANHGATVGTFRIMVVPSNEDPDPQFYIYKDYAVAAGEHIDPKDLELVLTDGDKVRWQGTDGIRLYASGIFTDQ
jgi:hypothetical protein